MLIRPAMKSTFRLNPWIPAAIAALALALVQPCAAVPPNPTPLDLGVLPGCDVSEAYDINAAGQVVGMSSNETTTPPVFLPFIWQDGVMSQLPLPDGCTQGTAMAINASGVIAGACVKETKHQACVWTPGRKGWSVTLLGNPTFTATHQETGETVAVTFTEHMAMKINGSGQVLVLAIFASEELNFRAAAIWQNGTWTFLTDAEGAPLAIGEPFFKLNESGQVLFWAETSDDTEYWNDLYLWDTVVATRLVNCVDWADMNNSGQVVGTYYNLSDARNENFTYDTASRTLTSSPCSASGGYLASINDSGQVAVVIPTFHESEYMMRETRLGLTTWADWMAGTAGSVLGTVNDFVDHESVKLNAAGEVSGGGYGRGSAFFASAAAGVVALGDRVPSIASQPSAMSNSGEIAGTSGGHAVLWCAGLAVGEAKATRKGKTVTVTVTLINTSTTRTAANVVVTSATLDGGSLAAPLPSIRTLAPGAKKSVTLSFTSDTQSGNQTFTLTGTSSLGGCSTTRFIAVP
jgi:probable HAF family extracellular repeat protein